MSTNFRKPYVFNHRTCHRLSQKGKTEAEVGKNPEVARTFATERSGNDPNLCCLQRQGNRVPVLKYQSGFSLIVKSNFDGYFIGLPLRGYVESGLNQENSK